MEVRGYEKGTPKQIYERGKLNVALHSKRCQRQGQVLC